MVEGITAGSRTVSHARLQEAGFIPAPRRSPENAGHSTRSHRAPSMAELVSEAQLLIRRDNLPASGYLVVQQRKGTALHQHQVWQLGPFALLDDGWFGQVHGIDTFGDKPARWLRRHERRCRTQHWTHFRWVDPASLEPGCGVAGIGLGRGANGPEFCPTTANRDAAHVAHVPLDEILRNGLRALATAKTA